MIHLAVAGYETRCATESSRDTLQSLLNDLESLIVAIQPELYTTPAGARSTVIGQQVARSLARIAGLVTDAEADTIRYPAPHRHLAVDPTAALRKVRALRTACLGWPRMSLSTVVRVRQPMVAGDCEVGWSTVGAEATFVISEAIDAKRLISDAMAALGRELAFVLSHTIHHQATMAALLALQGVTAPNRFGYAPSTPR